MTDDDECGVGVGGEGGRSPTVSSGAAVEDSPPQRTAAAPRHRDGDEERPGEPTARGTGTTKRDISSSSGGRGAVAGADSSCVGGSSSKESREQSQRERVGQQRDPSPGAAAAAVAANVAASAADDEPASAKVSSGGGGGSASPTTDDSSSSSGGEVGDADDDEEEEEDGATTTIVNQWDTSAEADEAEGVSLLRQIFPEETTEELKRIHRGRVLGASAAAGATGVAGTAATTATNTAISTSQHDDEFQTGATRPTGGTRPPSPSSSSSPPPRATRTILPHDFLRLPPDVAVRRYDDGARRWRYHLVRDMAQRAWERHCQAIIISTTTAASPLRLRSPYASLLLAEGEGEEGASYFSKSIFRDPKVGLGLSLYEQDGIVRVHSLTRRNGTTWHQQERAKKEPPQSPMRARLIGRSSDNSAAAMKTPPPRPRGDGDDETGGGGAGPAMQAGIACGDILVGINGRALLESTLTAANADGIIFNAQQGALLKYAVLCIHNSPDPVVLHLQRREGDQRFAQKTAWGTSSHRPTTPAVVTLPAVEYQKASTPSLLDTSDVLNGSQLSSNGEPSSFCRDDGDSNHHHLSFLERTYHSTPMAEDPSSTPFIHPFVATLRSRGLLQSFEDERHCTLMLSQFTERTRQWEATSCFRFLDDGDYNTSGEVLVPLMGVRKALSVRIVHSFMDGSESAFTIWVYDVETGNEWYAPIRYFRDFQDLRSALMHLIPSAIAQLPFPKQPLTLFGSPVRKDSPSERESKSRALEHFLRSLCTLIYRGLLHSGVAEVAIHLQSFLGCENVCLESFARQMYSLEGSSGLADNSANNCTTNNNLQSQLLCHVRQILKRNLQLYTYRLFVLDRVSAIVNTFVNSVRAKGPRLEDLEALEAQGRAVLKARAMEDLDQMKSFLDKMQDIIIEGCHNDFLSIAERDEYEAIHGMMYDGKKKGNSSSSRGSTMSSYWDRLVREAVREQVEIEVYVPLRSIVSRWLVQGWRHEDMEVQFKIKELRKRPPRHFIRGVCQEKVSPSTWTSVSKILKEGVGMSTLPCAKLRAIVESAREISRLYAKDEFPIKTEDKLGNYEGGEVPDRDVGVAGLGESGRKNLGADDFLPIFIYCVVQADMERPCALCVLLRALCDPINRLGEIGYYLASFEAAITHIQEVDLMEDREDMLSFLSVPLSDT